MNRKPCRSLGFTLIEMMISIALGSLIIYTAIAGMRSASQTITAGNRLSLENSLLRAGYFEAQDQLDFWTNLDDPLQGSPSLRPLTQINDNKGMPFTPMNQIMPISAKLSISGVPHNPNWNKPLNSIVPLSMVDIRAGKTREEDVGWDPSYSWAPHDPRTWVRANLAEKERHREDNAVLDPYNSLPPFYFGRYAIFANTEKTPGKLYAPTIKRNMNTPSTGDAEDLKQIKLTYVLPTTHASHTWYYRQVRGLITCMGYAAFCEYLPPNAFYTWYEPNDSISNTNEGGIARITAGTWNEWGEYFNNGDGDQRTPRGIYRQTYSRSYGYFNPRGYDNKSTATNTSPPSTATLRLWHYDNYFTNHNTSGDNNERKELQWFMKHVNFPESMMTVKPDQWPQTDVSVGRFIKNARHVALARVRQFSPYTGTTIELAWSGMGTSLRGARQQRHQASGWASWDNGPSATNDPNLDTP